MRPGHRALAADLPANQAVPVYLHFSSPARAKPVRLLTVNVAVPGPGG
jgi:hypothetical protein